MGISCKGAKYNDTMLPVAYFGILLYLFGIPVMYFVLTWFHRHLRPVSDGRHDRHPERR